MSAASPAALGGPLAAALAGAEPAATQQLQQLAAPAADAATKAAALRAQAEEAAGASAQQEMAPGQAAAAGAAEAATVNATRELGAQFSSVTPTGVPAVPCACSECIRPAVDPAVSAMAAGPAS